MCEEKGEWDEEDEEWLGAEVHEAEAALRKVGETAGLLLTRGLKQEELTALVGDQNVRKLGGWSISTEDWAALKTVKL